MKVAWLAKKAWIADNEFLGRREMGRRKWCKKWVRIYTKVMTIVKVKTGVDWG
jgi:hypothetical protein